MKNNDYILEIKQRLKGKAMKQIKKISSVHLDAGTFAVDNADGGDGRLLVGVQGVGSKYGIYSEDGGESWKRIDGRFDTPRMIRLQDGTYFGMGIDTPIKYHVNIKKQKKFPHVLQMKYAESFDAILDEDIQTDFFCVDIPDLNFGYGDGLDPKEYQLGYVSLFNQLDNGDILGAMYGQFKADKSKLDYFKDYYDMYQYRTWMIVSHDNGHTFSYLSTVADCMTYPGLAGEGEGFCEPDILDLGGGEVICVMRTQGHEVYTPMYICRSYDYGKTWDAPQKICDYGVYPRLLKLSDGTLVCASGKWDSFLLFSEDKGKTWSAPYVFKENKGQWERGPSGYCSIFETAPNELLVVYDDAEKEVSPGFWRTVYAEKFKIE